MNTPTYKAFIDFAADNNLEYIIIDDGWSGNESLLKDLESGYRFKGTGSLRKPEGRRHHSLGKLAKFCQRYGSHIQPLCTDGYQRLQDRLLRP
ncbi:hypothetical protein NIB75_00410 [Bacteroides uniformis]|nr:hypothetical protein [Bacteroides uniformis]